MRLVLSILLSMVIGVASTGVTVAAGWKAGVAKAVITPKQPLWMAGYGSRTKPAQGAQHDLWIRVLVLEDERGRRGVILSSDTLGIPRPIADDLADRLKRQFGLDRSQVLLHASHTHCGPVLRGALYDAYPLDPAQIELINQFSEWLTAEIVSTIGRAIEQLQPADVSRGQGHVDFAVNRRTNREPDVPKLREQNLLFGPVDHTIPVLAVNGPQGELLAIVFAYACHNTTLDYQLWCGDYAGFAQYGLEARHPGAVAMFCMGCGADQNPLPRRTVALAESYGARLASAVDAVLAEPMDRIEPTLRTQHEFVLVQMQGLPKIEELRTIAHEPASYRQRWAGRMLKLAETPDEIVRQYPYPITAWKLGREQLWITLGGEVVVDYAHRLKAELGDRTWVTAYVNDVMAYIPSRRVLIEGGYEGQSSMMVYGLPTERWADDVEERICAGVRRCAEKVESPER